MDNMYIDIMAMEQKISEFDNNISRLETIYSELNNKMKALEESNEIWSSETKEKAYEKYLTISNNFLNSIVQMESLKMFLNNTFESYKNSENKLNDTINNNEGNLDA